MFTASLSRPPDNRLDGPIHTWFSLTYANYLVIDPATTTQVNANWHQQMRAMLAEIEAAFAHVPQPDRYLALAGKEWEYGDLSDEQLRALDIATNAADLHEDCDCGPEPEGDKEADGPAWDRYRAWEDRRWEHEHDDLRWYDRNGDEWGRDRQLTVPDEGALARAEADPCVVVPRSFLQSMPTDWQERIVALLDGIDDESAADCYEVKPQRNLDGRWVDITDPVPHYNRGRTYIEPHAGDDTAAP